MDRISISQEKINKVKRKTAEFLGNRPSEQKIKPDELRRFFYAPITDEGDSVISLLLDVVNQANAITGATETSISNAQAAAELYSRRNLDTAKKYTDDKVSDTKILIDSEATARDSGDFRLRGDLQTEKNSRISADTEINTTLTQHASAIEGKLNKNNPTVNGDLTVTGNLHVQGTSSEIVGTAIRINDALVVTNADGTQAGEGMVGFVVVVNESDTDNAYGIIYQNDALELGIGTYSSGTFTFKSGENYPISLHDSMASGHMPVWNDTKKIFEDSELSPTTFVDNENERIAAETQNVVTMNEVYVSDDGSTYNSSILHVTGGRREAEKRRVKNMDAMVKAFDYRMTLAQTKISEANSKISAMNTKLAEYESVNQSALAIVNNANRLLETLGFAEEESY